MSNNFKNGKERINMIGSQNIFQQCHEHIRICEQRRDVAVGVLVTFGLAVLTVLEKNNGSQFGIKLAFSIIAVGFFFLLGLYRRWKLIHLHAASVFMNLSLNNTLPSKEQAETIWKEIIKKNDSRLQLRSGDLWLQLIAAAVSAVVVVPFIKGALPNNIIGWKLYSTYLLIIFVWFLVAWRIHIWATKDVHSFPEYAWMFRGLKNSNKDAAVIP